MTSIQPLPKFVYLYFLCQSINLTAAVISVAVAATVGGIIAPDMTYATIPYGTQFLVLLLCTYPAAIIMNNKGRKFGFIIGAVFLALAGVIGYIGINNNDFILLIISHACLGAFTACANYYRFAVTDNLSVTLKSRALSLVVAGGVLAGIIGPIIAIHLNDIDGHALYSLCYGVFVLLALLNLILISVLPKQKIDNKMSAADLNLHHSLNISNDTRNKTIIGILAAAIGYGLMNLLMIQSSMHMNHMGVSFKDTADAIQIHVVAMFLPSLFSGYLLTRFGHIPIIIVGFLLYIASFAINITDASYQNMYVSLILLGLGWNFTYVGGSALLAVALEHNPNSKKWQGVSDTGIAMMATLGAFSPSLLMGFIGWDNTNYLSLSLCVLMLVILFGYFVSSRRTESEECKI
ncbi:MFS transporter [Pseudomonas sp. HK3]